MEKLKFRKLIFQSSLPIKSNLHILAVKMGIGIQTFICNVGSEKELSN